MKLHYTKQGLTITPAASTTLQGHRNSLPSVISFVGHLTLFLPRGKMVVFVGYTSPPPQETIALNFMQYMKAKHNDSTFQAYSFY